MLSGLLRPESVYLVLALILRIAQYTLPDAEGRLLATLVATAFERAAVRARDLMGERRVRGEDLARVGRKTISVLQI